MHTEDHQGRIIAGRYRVRGVLGHGAHGLVYLAEDLGRGGKRVALKVVEGLVGEAAPNSAEEVLRRFRHPAWAAVLDQGSLGPDGRFQAVQFIPGRSLDRIGGPQPEALVWQLLEDGARVLGALHRRGLIHYDVTPGNILLRDGSARQSFVLTDGGLAHVGPVMGVARGTPLYMAPEVTEAHGHDHRADLYALGLVAYRLATGREAFEGGAGEVLGRRRREEAPRARTIRPELSEGLDRVLASLITRDPNGRPHDANAVLERLAEARGQAAEPFLHSEAMAVAEGGSLVGREDELARIRAGLDVLAEGVRAGSGRLARARARSLQDPVVLLRGPTGVGCTRLAEEALALARDASVPALLMAGGEATGDRRGPLRHLVDAMAALELAPDVEPQEIRLDLGSRRRLGPEERAHALTRAVEQFVRGVETTAQRTPFVLVVQGFADLPERAQEAVRVLSRHLLARRESGGSTSAPPVLLLVDLGLENAESMLVPDAQDRTRPLMELKALDALEVVRFCSDRFPGLEPHEGDVQIITATSEGLPGFLAMLLAEGCRRGDLAEESGRWAWKVEALSEYDIRRGLAPVHAEALRTAEPRLLRLLAWLSLVDVPLAAPLVSGLWAQGGGEPIPGSPLIQTVMRDTSVYYTPATLGVKKAILEGLTSKARHDATEELLAALEQQDSADTALDRARLLADHGHYARAVGTLRRHWNTLTSHDRLAGQKTVLRAVQEDASITDSPASRHGLSLLIEPTERGAALATALAERISATAEEAQTAACVAAALENARHYATALSLIDRVLKADSLAPDTAADLRVTRCWLLFDLHQVDVAMRAVRQSRRALRTARTAGHVEASVSCRHDLAEAQSQFHKGNFTRAALLLSRASVFAKASGQLSMRARVYNNQGIVQHQLGRNEASTRHLYRALRLRRLVGDMGGVTKCLLNLGRVEQLQGRLVKGASYYQQAATVAQRQAQPTVMARALRFLAQTYDQQLNARLAITTLNRALATSERLKLPAESARVAWDLGPLAAAAGDAVGSARALLLSARAARKRLTSYSRGAHFLTRALTALHLGLDNEAAIYVRRAERERPHLHHELLNTLGAVSSILCNRRCAEEPRTQRVRRPRPRVESPARHLWRSEVWFERCVSARCLSAPPLPLPRLAFASKSRPPGSGKDRRLLIEMALRVLRMAPPSALQRLQQALERHLLHTGEAYLLGRLFALRSTLTSDGPASAQQFSRAIHLVSSPTGSGPRQARGFPIEHLLARGHHSNAVGLLQADQDESEASLHSLAHRLLVHHGCTAAPDGRVASALRRVLDATGRMNAGAGLDHLLDGMTRDTIEITGAERTCVVLLDPNADLEMRVATSASAQAHDVGVEDLSQTVIQRVIDSRTPLLLHDVFDDEELMGRPSITSLSLRSILCVPMIRGETLYGVLYADSASAAGSFDHIDQEVLSLFAEQAAAALETHRLVADVQNSMAELKAMQERLVKGERLRTMGELSSGVAHEFNNLLTSILARVQLISLNNVGRELKQDLDLIEKACLDAAAVVRRLQSYTRQQRQEHFERVDLAEICSDAVEFLRPLWSTRRRHGRDPIVVRLRAAPGLHVHGNATELREVVTNLLKNSLDALIDGGEVTIQAYGADDMVHLRIEDDGPGIPDDVLERIFDPFFTTKGERGTGLGLCLSQQIVERHGGEMVLKSRLSEGTRVLIELPNAEAMAHAIDRTEAHESARPLSLRVLVVDDDENVRVPLCRFLERHGCEIVAAADGREGELLASQQRPDVVISDVAMPDVDGLELCRRLRRAHAALPIILMSGWSSGVDPARARRAGATALLAKPFALQQVTELLAQIAEAAHR